MRERERGSRFSIGVVRRLLHLGEWGETEILVSCGKQYRHQILVLAWMTPPHNNFKQFILVCESVCVCVCVCVFIYPTGTWPDRLQSYSSIRQSLHLVCSVCAMQSNRIMHIVHKAAMIVSLQAWNIVWMKIVQKTITNETECPIQIVYYLLFLFYI